MIADEAYRNDTTANACNAKLKTLKQNISVCDVVFFIWDFILDGQYMS